MDSPGRPRAGNIFIFNNGFRVWELSCDQSSVDEIVQPVDGANYRLAPGVAYAPAEPVWTYAEQLRRGREVPANQVYRAYRYAPDYPGLQGLDLTPGEPIELYDTP